MKKSAPSRNPFYYNVHKSSFLILFVLTVCAAIVMIVILQPTAHKPSPSSPKVQSQEYADPTAQLTFEPQTSMDAPLEVSRGEIVELNVTITPNNHRISAITPVIQYDPDVFTFISFTPNSQAFPVTIQPVNSSTKGEISASLGISLPLDNAVSTPTEVGVVRLRATRSTASPSAIMFSSQSEALSVAPLDGPSTNVISSSPGMYIRVH